MKRSAEVSAELQNPKTMRAARIPNRDSDMTRKADLQNFFKATPTSARGFYEPAN
jgi:hypothetical protein